MFTPLVQKWSQAEYGQSVYPLIFKCFYKPMKYSVYLAVSKQFFVFLNIEKRLLSETLLFFQNISTHHFISKNYIFMNFVGSMSQDLSV